MQQGADAQAADVCLWCSQPCEGMGGSDYFWSFDLDLQMVGVVHQGHAESWRDFGRLSYFHCAGAESPEKARRRLWFFALPKTESVAHAAFFIDYDLRTDMARRREWQADLGLSDLDYSYMIVEVEALDAQYEAHFPEPLPGKAPG